MKRKLLPALLIICSLCFTFAFTACGDPKPTTNTQAIMYTLNDDGMSYSVSRPESFSVTEIVIPSSYNDLPVTAIDKCAFSACNFLKKVTIPDSVTSIGEVAFYACNQLKNITIPDSVTSIGWSAFSCCTSVTSVSIGNGITTVTDAAFKDCTSLKSVNIPKSVTYIGEGAFMNCTSLASIAFDGTKAQWNAIEKNPSWNKYTNNYTVACTDGTVAKAES